MADKDRPYDVHLLNSVLDLMRLDRESHERSFEKLTAGLEKLSTNVDALTLNVGQLAQMQKQSSKNIQDLREAIRQQNEAINGHLAVAQAQTANIAELTKLGTVLVAKN
jgi:predicted  nucleic acid-binding Zn-ribbon protein